MASGGSLPRRTTRSIASSYRMILSSLAQRVTRGQVKNGKGGSLKAVPLFRNQVLAFLFEVSPEKHDVRRFPTEIAVKQFGTAPYIRRSELAGPSDGAILQRPESIGFQFRGGASPGPPQAHPGLLSIVPQKARHSARRIPVSGTHVHNFSDPVWFICRCTKQAVGAIVKRKRNEWRNSC